MEDLTQRYQRTANMVPSSQLSADTASSPAPPALALTAAGSASEAGGFPLPVDVNVNEPSPLPVNTPVYAYELTAPAHRPGSVPATEAGWNGGGWNPVRDRKHHPDPEAHATGLA